MYTLLHGTLPIHQSRETAFHRQLSVSQRFPADLSAKPFGPAPFKRLRAQFQNEYTVKLLLRKGIFPYRFLDSSEKFQEPLPSRDSFYNTLTKETCSEKDYEHVVKVWNHFGMKTFSEYHDVYLRVDVLLLADVFENFRDLAIRNYSVDPLHFYSVPGLA